MGGTVSAGKSNDELVDNLCKANLIKNPEIEKAFRLVDRGFFFPKLYEEIAYKDVAWKHCIYHISAPCIYAEVLNALEIHHNHSFLNIGSGSGYLSTLVGLLLGSNGVNNGVEICPKLVEFSMKNVETFCNDILNRQYSNGSVNHINEDSKSINIHQHNKIVTDIAANHHNLPTCYHENIIMQDSTTIANWDSDLLIHFCYPKVITADIINVLNMINLTPNEQDSTMLLNYDRIYCGASLTPGTHWVEKIKHLLNIDGILVIPLNDQLIKIRRNGVLDWSSETIMAASFAPLLLRQGQENHCDSIILNNIQTFFSTRFPPNLYDTCKYATRKFMWDLSRTLCINQSHYFEKLESEEDEYNEPINKSCTLRWYYTRKYILDQTISCLPLPKSIRQNLKFSS